MKIHLDPFKAVLKNIGKELEGLEEGFEGERLTLIHSKQHSKVLDKNLDSKKEFNVKIHLDQFKAALKKYWKNLEGIEEGFSG